jgi:hypothetical protein
LKNSREWLEEGTKSCATVSLKFIAKELSEELWYGLLQKYSFIPTGIFITKLVRLSYKWEQVYFFSFLFYIYEKEICICTYTLIWFLLIFILMKENIIFLLRTKFLFTHPCWIFIWIWKRNYYSETDINLRR